MLTNTIKLAQSGDEAAFNDLYREYNKQVQKVLYPKTFCEDERNYLSNTVWIKIWKKLNTFEGTSSFSTWVSKIALYTYLDYLDINKRWTSFDRLVEDKEIDLDGFVDNETPFAALQESDDAENYREILGGLPDGQRLALDYYANDGLSYKQISVKLKIPIGTVQSRISVARNRIKEIIRLS